MANHNFIMFSFPSLIQSASASLTFVCELKIKPNQTNKQKVPSTNQRFASQNKNQSFVVEPLFIAVKSDLCGGLTLRVRACEGCPGLTYESLRNTQCPS